MDPAPDLVSVFQLAFGMLVAWRHQATSSAC
jgi:hypothetical protein